MKTDSKTLSIISALFVVAVVFTILKKKGLFGAKSTQLASNGGGSSDFDPRLVRGTDMTQGEIFNEKYSASGKKTHKCNDYYFKNPNSCIKACKNVGGEYDPNGNNGTGVCVTASSRSIANFSSKRPIKAEFFGNVRSVSSLR